MKHPVIPPTTLFLLTACFLALATANAASEDSRDDTSLWGIAPEANEIKVKMP